MTLPPLRYLGDPIERKDLGGVFATVSQYPSGQVQPWHDHATPNASFLLKGAFRDESKPLGECFPDLLTLVFHPANEPHRCEAGPQGRTSLNLEPTSTWLEEHSLTDNAFRYRLEQGAETALPLVRLALDVEPLAGGALAEALFGRGEGEETQPWLRRVNRLLEADEVERWTLSKMAAEIGVHPVYLARVYRKRFGRSLTETLLRHRVLRAARRVREGRSLGEIAHEAGFADHAHFSRSFRRVIGVTPRAYRDAR